jgi:tetratricopeptide (TPR) repeat protein
MEPNHDIYRKEDPPPFKKRRRRSSSEGQPSGNIPSASPRPDSAPRDDKTPRIENWGALTPQREHRSRTTRGTDRTNRLLWIGLAAVFGIYVIFLAVSVLRGKKTASAASELAQTAGSAQATAMPTGTTATAEAPFGIADKIAAWNHVPDTLLDAQSLLDQGSVEQAESKLEHALESTPHVSRLQIKLSQILIQRKQYDKAKALLVDVLESNPEDSTARLMLAGVLDQQTNYPAALAVAKWILETDPNSIEANGIAANAYLNTDRKGLAVTHLRKIVVLQRDNPFAQNKLAMTYTQMGEYVKAIQLFNEVLANNTADSMTYYNLAVCYAKMSDADQAVETLTRAMSLFGRDFVSIWIQSPDFDKIRNESIFMALQTSGNKPGETNAPARIQPAATNASAGEVPGTPP